MEVALKALDISGLSPLLDSIFQLKSIIDVIKSNSQQFSRISERLDKLKKLVLSIREMGQIKDFADVRKALNNLQQALTEATNKIEKYQNGKPLVKILRASHYETKFKDVNERLSDAYEELSGTFLVGQNQIQEELKREQEELKREQEEQKREQEEQKREQERKQEREQEKKLQEHKREQERKREEEKCVIL